MKKNKGKKFNLYINGKKIAEGENYSYCEYKQKALLTLIKIQTLLVADNAKLKAAKNTN